MKKNRFTQILGKNVILVPYKAEHVPKYIFVLFICYIYTGIRICKLYNKFTVHLG